MTGFWGGSANFCVWEVGGFWRNGTTDSLIDRYVSESLTVTYRSFTWRSRTFQYVFQSVSVRPAICCVPLRAFTKDASFDCVTAFKSCLRAETLSASSSAGERLSLEQHFTFGDIWV